MVGASAITFSASRTSSRRAICAIRRTANSESPPSAKKSSKMPIGAVRNSSWKQVTSARSVSLRGAAASRARDRGGVGGCSSSAGALIDASSIQ